MKRSLGEGWKVVDYAPGDGDALVLSKPGFHTSAWHDIQLPGDVNAVLVRDGRMPDPHFGDNARQCYWVTAREWWFRREFTVAPADLSEVTELVLDGVDGHVDLYLNGQCLGRLENAFRPHRFDVGEMIRTDAPNVLLLRFRAIEEVLGRPRGDDILASWNRLRVLMRKPQFSFGWDWALPLPSIGVMGNIRIEHRKSPRIVDVSVQPHANGRLDFKFQVNIAARDAGYRLKLRVRGHGADIETVIERPGRCFSHTSVQIENPALWWPRGMGKQPLYEYCVELIVDGSPVDRRAGRLGIREVRIEEDPFTPDAGPGISFWFNVNGRRVFCKGGNWIPLELWPAQCTDEQYRFALEKAAEANFNMLRVWGGGIYERDIFYDLCDELGIMIWQDFMFVSAGYPADLLRNEIVAEADYQIRRLRNHPCIVLWCGCNEDVFSWSLPNEENPVEALLADSVPDTGDPGELKINRLRDDPLIYTMLLRGIVSKLGLGVPYVESSPQSYEDAGNCPESGNSHLSCWKYALFICPDRPEQFRRHFDAVQSFDSEFCIQGPCCERTFRQFMPEEHLWPPDDMWTYHIQRGHKNLPHHEQTLQIAGGIFGEIDSLQKYIKYGQATHVEMMRAEFESARRDRPNNGGTMVWMYNDCWPTANWSIIDYYRRPKPAYYAAKRACASLLPIIFERKGKIEFFFSNDGLDPVTAEVRFGAARLDGATVWAEEQTVDVGPVDTVRFYVIDRKETDFRPDEYLFVEARAGGADLFPVTYFPDGWKHVPWPVPDLKITLLEELPQTDGTHLTKIEIRTDAYARFCHVVVDDAAGPVWLDDNFFDLPAGHSHVIRIRCRQPLSPDLLTVGTWHSIWP